MPLLVVFLPLIAFGIGVLVGYHVQPENIEKASSEVFGPEPGVKLEKELPKWDRRT
jgi:hypothetical protein